jgi:acyl carrier protein
MSVEETLKTILLDILEIDEKEIVPGASITNDLEASSIDVVEIIAALETELNIDISDEDLEAMRTSDGITVQGIIDYLNTKTS